MISTRNTEEEERGDDCLTDELGRWGEATEVVEETKRESAKQAENDRELHARGRKRSDDDEQDSERDRRPAQQRSWRGVPAVRSWLYDEAQAACHVGEDGCRKTGHDRASNDKPDERRNSQTVGPPQPTDAKGVTAGGVILGAASYEPARPVGSSSGGLDRDGLEEVAHLDRVDRPAIVQRFFLSSTKHRDAERLRPRLGGDQIHCAGPTPGLPHCSRRLSRYPGIPGTTSSGRANRCRGACGRAAFRRHAQSRGRPSAMSS